MSSNVLYRLYIVEDWKRHEEWCLENDCKSHRKMLSRLCDYSIQRLMKYCDTQLIGHNFNCSYYYDLHSLVLNEMTDRNLDFNILVRENTVKTSSGSKFSCFLNILVFS